MKTKKIPASFFLSGILLCFGVALYLIEWGKPGTLTMENVLPGVGYAGAVAIFSISLAYFSRKRKE
ncbi:hypothetical protein ACQZV8_16840 [Magnetococcales bacterium HHB-1]